MERQKRLILLLLAPILFFVAGCNNEEVDKSTTEHSISKAKEYSVDDVIEYLNNQKNHSIDKTVEKDENDTYTLYKYSFSYLRSSNKFGLYHYYYYSHDGYVITTKVEGTFRWDNFEYGDYSGSQIVNGLNCSNPHSIKANMVDIKVNACPTIDSCSYNVLEYTGTVTEADYVSAKFSFLTSLRSIATYANNITTGINNSLTLW